MDSFIQWYYSAGATGVGSVPSYNIATWANISDPATDNTILNEVTFNLSDADLGPGKYLTMAFEPRYVDDVVSNLYIVGFSFEYSTTGGTVEVNYPSTAASYTDTY